MTQSSRSGNNLSEILSGDLTSAICIVQPSESVQTEPLPAVVIRPPLRTYKTHKLGDQVERALQCAKQISEGLCIVCVLPSQYSKYINYHLHPENRSYILKALKRGNRISKMTLQTVLESLANRSYFVLHFRYADQKRLKVGNNSRPRVPFKSTENRVSRTLIPASEISQSNVQVTFRAVKGLAGTGRKSCQDATKDKSKKIKSYNLTVQLDMFVSTHLWSCLDDDAKSWLFCVIRCYEKCAMRILNPSQRKEQGASKFPISKYPVYFTQSRNSFDFRLKALAKEFGLRPQEDMLDMHEAFSKMPVKTKYYFESPEELPIQYDTTKYPISENTGLFSVGVTTIEGLFNEQELKSLEDEVNQLASKSKCRKLRSNTFHCNYGCRRQKSSVCANEPSRTKYFFGAGRYLWGKRKYEHDDHPRAAYGIRVGDIDLPSKWMRKFEASLVKMGVIEGGFVNQFAINVYHDGSDGIAQHIDDANRFARPIVSIRLFSDSRLSFGSKHFYQHDSSFFVPMPRGAITILEPDSFAANDISHCVRPIDMTGRSAVIILRHIRKPRLIEATNLAIGRLARQFAQLSIDPSSAATKDCKTKTPSPKSDTRNSQRLRDCSKVKKRKRCANTHTKTHID